MADGVPLQVGRVYVRNAGMVFATAFCQSDLVPFSSIDLDSGSANDKGFTQRAERLEQDVESFADNRKKGRGSQDNVRPKQVSKCQARSTCTSISQHLALAGKCVAPGFRLFHGCSWLCSMWLTQEKSHGGARRARLGLDEARYG